MLPNFPRSSGSWTGPIEPREYSWGANERKELACLVHKTEITAVRICRADHATPSVRKFGANFADKQGRSVGIVRSHTKATMFSVV
jgi:hypothetical protein